MAASSSSAVIAVRGMVRQRRCGCGATLTTDDGDTCKECRPQLSTQAQAIGDLRKQFDDRIAALEREMQGLHVTIKKVEKKLQWQSSKQRRTSEQGS
jgi:hypothetical protein